jgi:DNA-binding transcriptional ArsR family regulator
MTPDRLDATFTALADPTRRAILARLASGAASVTELADRLRDEPAGDIKASQGAGARRTDFARSRRAAPACRLEAAALGEATEWLERYRQLWEASFQRLFDALLDELQTERRRNPDAHEAIGARR